jgi:hypothetical protein
MILRTNRKFWRHIARISFAIVPAVSLLTFSCATPPIDDTRLKLATQLPADIPIKIHPGFTRPLTVTLHLASGAEFNCMIDTCSPTTTLPKSVAGQLGKCLFKRKISFPIYGDIEEVGIYKTPAIYLGETQLVMDDQVEVGNQPEGILGMDCLCHYCVQMDFSAGKIRFLDPHFTNLADLGTAFPLTSLRYARIHDAGFSSESATDWLMIDTGFQFDGILHPKVFEQMIHEQKAEAVPLKVFGATNKPIAIPKLISIPTLVWHGETYTNVIIQSGRENLLGLKFLARHQVTFDFPNRMLYLKPR